MRLKILERDQFTCQSCGDDKRTLHVHHFEYSKNPWESSEHDLITLCDSCHEWETGKDSHYKAWAKFARANMFSTVAIETFIIGVTNNFKSPNEVIEAFNFLMSTKEGQDMIMRLYEKYLEDAFNSIING